MTIYIYHSGSGTLLDAADDVFIFSDEGFTDEEKEALDSGDTEPADGAGVKAMTVINFYCNDGKKKKKGKK